MKLREIVTALHLEVLSGAQSLEREAGGGYCSDLLSDVMAHARPGDVWITLQTHANVVAVATLVGVAAVVITGGLRPDADTLARAESEGAVLLTTADFGFEVAGRLHAMLRTL